jgi:hypothetical protein
VRTGIKIKYVGAWVTENEKKLIDKWLGDINQSEIIVRALMTRVKEEIEKWGPKKQSPNMERN